MLYNLLRLNKLNEIETEFNEIEKKYSDLRIIKKLEKFDSFGEIALKLQILHLNVRS